MAEEKDPILFTQSDQPPGTITLWVMVKRDSSTWISERRILKIGSAEHLRYAIRNAERDTELNRQIRKRRKEKS